jgi:hypothetical protein
MLCPMRLPILLCAAAALACEGPPATQPATWTVWVSPDAPWPVGASADDIATELAAMGREVERGEGAPPSECVRGEGHVVLVGETIAGAAIEGAGATDQTWRIHELRCEDAVSLVELAGGGLLGRQYAAYEWLHHLGVRFFHPEQTYRPEEPAWPEDALEIEHTAPFRWRSVSLHLTHPLELGDAFYGASDETVDEAIRFIDWQVRNGASRGSGGVGSGEHAMRGIDRGFPLGAGFSLHNTQQGGRPLIDPDDPRPVNDQIADAIDTQMNREDGRVPQVFGFTFNPSEFTEIPDTEALDQITFIADYLGEHYPDTIVETINHGTAGEPTATYGVRYFDLPELAPANLGVKVHTLMFYDLFRPAPVYGNDSFQFMYDFMARNYRTRALTYYPESAWWLTFDIAVPLYLPITVEARDRDIQSIAWMLEGKLDGHHVFGSGHEWGYWQNEYCSFRMASDLSIRWRDCFRDITGTMGEVAGPETQAVLEELVLLQERDVIYSGILQYLVGTDPETEVAASVGIDFHPLPPAPAAMLRWDRARVDAFFDREMPLLQRMDADYAALVERLRAVEASVPERGLPFFSEILDGIEATGLRARHAWQVYGSIAMLRDSQLREDPTLLESASDLLADARASTEAALAVIHRREAGYRYSPLDRAIAGGPEGNEDENWTVYRYRYLNRTHHAYYYTRIDALAAATFEGGSDPVTISDAMLAPGESIVVTLLDASFGEPVVSWGDESAAETEGRRFEHAYAAVGVYPFSIGGRLGAEPFALAGDVASLTTEDHTGFSGVITEPPDVGLIEPVMPGLTFGPIDETRVALGFSAVPEGTVALGAFSVLMRDEASSALLATLPARIEVPVVNRGTGVVQARMTVHDAVLVVEDETSPAVLTGALDTEAVIGAVVAIGGFEPRGARGIVASTLGYTPDTLPERVAFRIEYTITP